MIGGLHFSRSRHAGFTLVEMLLAMTLMSMLLALAYGGLRASTRATQKGQQILEDSGRIRMAHQFVRKQINQLLPLAFSQNDDGTERTVFLGDSRGIRYVAPMPGYLGWGGPQVQELYFEQGEEGLELVLSHTLLQGFDEQYLYQAEPIFLLGDISNARFSFLGRDENGELTSWSENWDLVDTLPAAISLEVEFNEDVYIHWPMLTTSVRVDASALSGTSQPGQSISTYSTTIQDLMKKRGKQQ